MPYSTPYRPAQPLNPLDIAQAREALGLGVIPSAGAGIRGGANGAPWNGLPWANQMQWAPEQGDPYFNPPPQQEDFGYGIEAGLVGGRFPAQTGGNIRGGARGNPQRALPVGGSITPNNMSHWDFTHGRMVDNNFAGGAQFNPQAANNLIAWAAAQAGNPNALQGDEGANQFLGGGFQMDESGALSQSGNNRNLNYRRPTHQLFNNPGSIASYNAAIGQPVSQAFTQPFSWMNPEMPLPRAGSGGESGVPPEYTTPYFGIEL